MDVNRRWMQALVAVPLIGLAAACANMGRPEGGPRDETPPVFVRSDPMPGQVNFTKKRLTAYFDENIQLEDAFTKVVVSPAQKTPPQVTANGRRLTVEFRDTLLDSTTYSIDFGDAIKDLNEGNILDGFALDFSTGPTIDTLRISGIVLQAENLEPAQGMLVGVYSNLSDTAISTLPMERIARTNQLGQFTIRNLAPGEYRVFAVNDVNRDYHWDRSEDVAFYSATVSPYVESITVADTLFAADRSDSIVFRDGRQYLPNDVFLAWFNTGYKSSYLADYKRPERRRITLDFGAPQDTLPEVRIVDGAPGAGELSDRWALRRVNATADSLEYWIADTTVLAADSLRLSVRYLKTDTTDNLVWTTDTLRFFFKDPKTKDKKKKKDKDKEEEAPTFRVDSLTGDTIPLPPPDMEYFNLTAVSSTRHHLYQPVILDSDVPWLSLDSAGVHLEIQDDTLWRPLPVRLLPDSANVLTRRKIEREWTPGAHYRLSIDTLAARSIYGTWNRPFAHEFTVTQPEDYANLIFRLPETDSIQAVVELLSSSDEPVRRVVKPTGTEEVTIRYIDPGTYYARLIVDTNANGKWDTGSIADNRQPEDVYYFAKKLNLKKNWDVEQTWLLDELSVDTQKPYAIKKNKPKLQRGEQAPVEEEESWEDEQERLRDPFTPRSNRSGSGGTSGMRRNTTNTAARR